MAKRDQRRGTGELLFAGVLAVLSALAIWYVEAERPRREAARIAATQTQVAVGRRAATARAQQIATTQARQTAATATSQARLTVTTRAQDTTPASERPTMSPALTAAAEYEGTATERAARGDGSR